MLLSVGTGPGVGKADNQMCPPVIVNMTSKQQDRLGRQLLGDHLLTPQEVAAYFRVDPKTVTRWARDGKLNAIRTLGGHRRYREAEVLALLEPPVNPAA